MFLHLFLNYSPFYRLLVRGFYRRRDTFCVIRLSQSISTSPILRICLRVSTQQYSQSNTVLITFVPLFIVLETETNKAFKFRTVSSLNFEFR